MNVPRTQAYLNLIEKLLNRTSEAELQQCLTDNQELLDETFADTLYQWAITTLPTLQSEQTYELARVIFNFSILIEQFPLGNRGSNLEIAIKGYQSVAVFTRDTFPDKWARTQTNLGTAYSDRIRGEKAENLEKALACYREALKVYTPDAFPQECLLTGRNLGDLAFGEGNWQLAIEAYSKAVEAVELSRSWAMTLQSKQEVMEAAIVIYYNIVQAYVNTEQNSPALEYVERSKTRNLVELLTARDLKPRGDFTLDILAELNRLRNKLRNEQIYLANQERTYSALSRSGQPSQPSLPDRTLLKQLQQELDELILHSSAPQMKHI